ncbi:uncharacterized protein ARMOST_19493 [Armillaria ostoyae]|uniref:Uncharacterized protein n=1 Tax=Armillaria ostoyae TaxID=47428 RepID=A0A284S4Q7_ARMOS|nr:uncharacterized protein ARMOST_19493 [Armillaria ostoyae]
MSFPSTLHPVDPSDLHLLMSTNIPPTINQRLSLQMALTHRTSDIASLYQTLDDCKKMHLRLHREIVTAEKDIGSIKAITHPVRVLPPELLREIFMYRRKGGFNVGAKCVCLYLHSGLTRHTLRVLDARYMRVPLIRGPRVHT